MIIANVEGGKINSISELQRFVTQPLIIILPILRAIKFLCAHTHNSLNGGFSKNSDLRKPNILNNVQEHMQVYRPQYWQY